MTADLGFTTTAANGCTGELPSGRRCGTQQTVVLSARDGRRCAEHADDLPEAYRRELAMDLVDAGRPSRAFAWLRAALARRSTPASWTCPTRSSCPATGNCTGCPLTTGGPR